MQALSNLRAAVGGGADAGEHLKPCLWDFSLVATLTVMCCVPHLDM